MMFYYIKLIIHELKVFVSSFCNSIIAFVFFSTGYSALDQVRDVFAEEVLPVVHARVYNGPDLFYDHQRPVVAIHTGENLGDQNEGIRIGYAVAEPSIILLNQEDTWTTSQIQGVATCVAACAFLLPQFYADFAVIDPLVFGFSAICIGARFARSFANTYGHCFPKEEFQRKEAKKQVLFNLNQIAFYVPAISQVYVQMQGAYPEENLRCWGFALLFFAGLKSYLGEKSPWNI